MEILATIRSFFLRYCFHILCLGLIALFLVLCSLPTKVKQHNSAQKKALKTAEKVIDKQEEKIQVFQDSVVVKDQKIATLRKKVKVAHVNDSLLYARHKQVLHDDADYRTPSAAQQWLRSYRPVPYDTL